MRRHAFICAGLIAIAAAFAVLPSTPSFAVSAQDKMATCKFGADDQKLDGAARAAFMKKCMSSHNDPRGTGHGAPAAAAAPLPPKQ
jgi:psiF repeat